MELFLLSSLLGLGALALDRASKWLALRRLNGAACVRLSPAIRLHLARNRRLGRKGLKPLVGVWLAAACSAVFLLFGLSAADPPAGIARATSAGLGLALAGAAGNLIDLARQGAVIDFIDFDLGGVFNLADVAIWFGTLSAALGLGFLIYQQIGGL